MARKLTIGRFAEIAVLALFVLGLVAGIVVPMDAVPAVFTEATTTRKAGMVVGLYLAFVLVLSILYRMLPESRV